MAGLAKTVTENPALRRVAIPAYRLYARAMVFNPGPRVLAVSMPKAGTHLLSALLRNMPHMRFSGRHHVLGDFLLPGVAGHTTDKREADWSERQDMWESELSWDRFDRMLASVNRGQFMTAHFAPLPKLLELLERLEYKTVVITRDPRDVVVSGAHYVAGLQRHRLHQRFSTELATKDDRLLASITGLPPSGDEPGLASIGRRMARYGGWLQAPSAYVSRFEDLIGPNGGGSREAQRREIEAIAAHIARPLMPEQVDAVAAKTWSSGSTTFRKGAIGDWKNHFSDAHRAAFKREAGEQLIELGYEQAADW